MHVSQAHTHVVQKERILSRALLRAVRVAGCDQVGVGDSENGAAVCILGSQRTGTHTHVQHVDHAHTHTCLRCYVAI